MNVAPFENKEFKASSSHEFGVKEAFIQMVGKVSPSALHPLKDENMSYITIYTSSAESFIHVFMQTGTTRAARTV